MKIEWKKSHSDDVSTWWRLRNRKRIVVVLFVIFLILGIVVSYPLFGSKTIETLSQSGQESIRFSHVTISPKSDSQLWITNETLYIYGEVEITPDENQIVSLSIDDTSPVILDESYVFELDALSEGHHNLRFNFEDNESLQIGVIRIFENLIVFQISWFLSGILLFLVASILLQSAVVFFPLTKKMYEFEMATPQKGNPILLEEQIDLALPRLDELRNHMNNQIEHYRELKAMLLTTLAVILSGYGVLSTVILSIAIGFFQGVFVLALIMSTGILCVPFFYLLQEHQIPRKTGSMWSYEKTISDTKLGVSTFEFDKRRIAQKIQIWDERKILFDSIEELTYLYYENRRVVEQYRKARKWFIISLILLNMLVGIGISYLFWFGPYVAPSFSVVLGFITFFLAIWAHYSFYKNELVIERLTLYWAIGSEKYDLDANKNLDEVETLENHTCVQVVDTRTYFDNDWMQLEKIVKENTKIVGRPSKKRLHLYGLQAGSFEWCGREVPILTIERIGESRDIQILPYCVNRGKITTIADYLKQYLAEKGISSENNIP